MTYFLNNYPIQVLNKFNRFDFNLDKCSCIHRDFSNYQPIDKNLLFIWIGEKLPVNSKYIIEQYQKSNPTFNIVLIHIKDLDTSDNKYAIELKKILNNCPTTNAYCGLYNSEFLKKLRNSKQVDKNVAFSDVLRFYILNDIGGIYCDLDTFPNKPFDEQLLKYNFYVQYLNTNAKENALWTDIYFFGMKKNTISLNDTILFDKQIAYRTDLFLKSPYFDVPITQKMTIDNFDYYKQQFVQQTLIYKKQQFNEHDYIAHFYNRSWSCELMHNKDEFRIFDKCNL